MFNEESRAAEKEEKEKLPKEIRKMFSYQRTTYNGKRASIMAEEMSLSSML